MTGHEFKNIWNKDDDELHPFSLDSLKDLDLKPKTVDFLTSAGLPTEAAPFLTFVYESNDLKKTINRLTDRFSFLKPAYGKYIVIGFDGSGNQIVINTSNNDIIECLDHENNFSVSSLNNSLPTFCAFLLIYRDFVEKVLVENGEDAIMDSNFSDQHFEELETKMRLAESAAVTNDGFWKEQLAILLGNRDYYLNNG